MIDFSIVLPVDWRTNPPAAWARIDAVQSDLGILFPDEFVEFLLWSDGGEGYVSRCYLAIWEIEEMAALNRDYEIGKWIPGLVGFGSDGGGQCYAFDYRAGRERPTVVRVPYGDLDSESVVKIGADFLDAVNRMKTGEVEPG